MHCSAKYFSLALVLSSVGLAGAQGVFFSEYIEGSSNNKASSPSSISPDS